MRVSFFSFSLELFVPWWPCRILGNLRIKEVNEVNLMVRFISQPLLLNSLCFLFFKIKIHFETLSPTCFPNGYITENSDPSTIPELQEREMWEGQGRRCLRGCS